LQRSRNGHSYGEWPGEGDAHRLELPGDPRQERLRLRGDVLADEEVLQPRVRAVAVQVHHLGAPDVEAGGAGHVELEGDVGEEPGLHLERGLHLDERPAAREPLQDVDVGEGAPGRDARLEDGRSAAGERGPGRLGLHRDVRGIGVDEDAAGEPLPRQLADPVATIEHRLQGPVGHELRGLGLVDFPPEPPEALQPREELGPMDDGRGGHSRKRTAARRVRSKPVATAVPGGGDQRLALVVFRLVRADGRFRFEAPGSPSQMTASTLLPSRSMTNAAYAA